MWFFATVSYLLVYLAKFGKWPSSLEISKRVEKSINSKRLILKFITTLLIIFPLYIIFKILIFKELDIILIMLLICIFIPGYFVIYNLIHHDEITLELSEKEKQ